MGHHGHDHMVVGFTTTYAINVCHHLSCEFEFCSWRGILETTLCDKVCQGLPTGKCFFPYTLVSSTNKTDRHNITEILLKVELNTINLNQYNVYEFGWFLFSFLGLKKKIIKEMS